MSDSSLNLALLWAPIVISLLILAGFGYRREMANRREQDRERELTEGARTAQLPAGAVPIYTRTSQGATADRSGRIMLILVGSFAGGVSTKLLNVLARSGLEGVIGSILLIELDSRLRQRFLESVPPVFLDRLIAVDCSTLPGGMGGRKHEKVMEHIDVWGPAVLAAANAVCERHQRLHRGEEAALALTFISQGGQAITGVKAVEAIARTFRMAQFYGFTALPVDSSQRVQVKSVLDAYYMKGVRGFVISDNLGDDVRNDFGMVASIVGLSAAAENADAPVEQNNAWNLLFSDAPGGLVRYGTYAHQLPGYLLMPTHPSVPSTYYVYEASVVSTVHQCLKEVRRCEFDSLMGQGLDEDEPDTTRFDIVLAAVTPDALKSNEDDVILGGALNGQPKKNYHLLFAPFIAEMDTKRPLCPVAVVSLSVVHNAEATLRHLTMPSSPQLPVISVETEDEQMEDRGRS